MSKQTQANPFKSGDKVLRRSDTSFVLVGTVEAVSANRCLVVWPGYNRSNGNGTLHTAMKHTTLIVAKPEIIKKRQIKFLQTQIDRCRQYNSPKLAEAQAKLNELLQAN